MPDTAARRPGAPATWREAAYTCTRQPLADLDELRDLSIARRLSANGVYLRWRDRVAEGGGDQAASKIPHDEAPEGRKDQIRKRRSSLLSSAMAIGGAIRIQKSSFSSFPGPVRPSIEELSRAAAMTITRRSSIAATHGPDSARALPSSAITHLPRTPEPGSPNESFPWKNTKLDVKREVKWERDSLRGTRDHGALLGGALARSLDHSLVL